MSIRTLPAVLVVGFILAVVNSSCASPPEGTRDDQVPELYRVTRDQAGHELVKTEQFVVPVGTTIAVPGLEFTAPGCVLSEHQVLLVRQVFNSIEEITENTVGDTVTSRVAEFRKMTFDVRALAAGPQGETKAGQCARNVMGLLTENGTPQWRLRAVTAVGPRRDRPGARLPDSVVVVEFVRTK